MSAILGVHMVHYGYVSLLASHSNIANVWLENGLDMSAVLYIIAIAT